MHALRLALLGILAVACNRPAPNGAQPQTPAAVPPSMIPDPVGLAANLVASARVKPGELVRVQGGGRDLALLEEIGIAVMKVGGHPLITVSGERFVRRAFDECAAASQQRRSARLRFQQGQRHREPRGRLPRYLDFAG